MHQYSVTVLIAVTILIAECEINAYRHARTGVTLQCSENLEVYLLRILIVQNAASELIKRGLGLTVSWSQRVYDSIQKKLILMTS